MAAISDTVTVASKLATTGLRLHHRQVRAGRPSGLATQGQLGFDTFSGHYFHRELPFDLALVTKLQPRLRDAHKLVDGGCVACVKPGEFAITSTDTVHRVRLWESDSKCTCPWYAKHETRRGPCKHILAAQIVAGRETQGIADDT